MVMLVLKIATGKKKLLIEKSLENQLIDAKADSKPN